MKITFVLACAGWSGGTRVIAIYADRLRRRGHEVFIVSQPRIPTRWRGKLKRWLRGGQWHDAFPVGSHLDRIDVPHRMLERWRPVTDADVPDADVVIATWHATAPWVMGLSPRKGARAYFIQGWEVVGGIPPEQVEATWRLPMHKITISRWLVDLARDRFGDDDVSLVPNGVDLEQFHAPPRDRQAKPTVGLLYSTDRHKGCDLSLKAIELAQRQVPNLRVVAFGHWPLSPELPLPAEASYTCSPAQDRIKDLYAQCDVWLCGSRNEGFHLPPLEAMACRCPVVSAAVGGPMDVIDDGVNGFLVTKEDVPALADRLTHVLQLPAEQWRRMSDAAYGTATEYGWDQATDRFEAGLWHAIEYAQDTRGRARVSATAGA
jgi:glycosyltransferase involved in cell wall biosynthesis